MSDAQAWNRSVAVARSDNVVSCELDGGIALLDLNSSKYFRLNETAGFVWDAMTGPTSVDELCRQMTAHYEVEEDRCLKDIVAILDNFEQSGLVTRESQ